MDVKFMAAAINAAHEGMNSNGGGPFGAVVVKGGKIIGSGSNCVTKSNDPTAHAEVMAIRDACNNLGNFQLGGCEIYTTCEPCPMCLGAIYWSRPDRVYYACDKHDASDAGFDDGFIYDEISVAMPERRIPFSQVSRDEALGLFKKWNEMENRREY